MVKATRLSAVLLGLTALGLWVSSVPAFAELQDVKVGGDVTTRAFVRSNLDLQDSDGTLDDHDRFIQLTTGLNVAANLTENVAAGLRLANETTYGVKDAAGSDFAVSQAWVRLKELFYSPLTVTLGRQPIVWGRGFIIGSGLIRNIQAATAGDLHASIPADEYTDFVAVDAARAQLDFQGAAAVDLPLLLDFVYIKQAEGTVGVADDINIVGVNAGTKLDAAEFETYFVNKRDRSDVAGALDPTTPVNHGSVNTMGVRGSASPVEGSSIYGELAYQFGTRVTDPSGILAAGDRHQAWAANLGAEFGANDVPASPKVGGEWIWYSGNDSDGAVAGWNSILPGYFRTALRQFQTTGFYPPDEACVVSGTAAVARCTGSDTNQHELALYGSLTPLEDLTIAPRLSWFIQDVGAIPRTVGSKRRSFIGTEWDTQVTYNYTSDVQFGLLYGLFLPGSVYRTPRDAAAQELVTTVGIKF